MIQIMLVFIAICEGVLTVTVLLKGRRDRDDVKFGSMMMMEFQKELNVLRSVLNDQMVDLSKQMSDQFRTNTQFLEQSHQGYQETVGQVQHRLGELFLAELLRQILPEEHYAFQYQFRDGSKVDTVIFLGDGMISVDAKFPLENFERILSANTEEDKKNFVQDVRKHIDAIASKYILPEEGSFDFALMYIPAENVYYETIIKDEFQNESLSSYAIQHRVIPVSPNSFYAYLQAIVRGLKGLRIEKSAKAIRDSLGQLETDFWRCIEDFEKMGGHMENAQSAYRRTEKRLGRIQDRLSTIGNQNGSVLLEESAESGG